MKKPTKKSSTHHAARSRAQLARNLRPLVDEVVERLVDVAWGQASTKLEVAMSAAMSVLADPEPDAPAPAEPDVILSPPARKAPRAAAPRATGTRKCSACQQLGHRRPQCPTLAPSSTTSEPEIEPEPEVEVDEDESAHPSAPAPASTPAADRADRFAQIEASARRRQEALR